jgi:putative ATPase
LLSRCQVYTLQPLSNDDLLGLMERVLKEDPVISKRKVEVKETSALLRYAGGDCRKFLNILDLVCGEYADDDFDYADDIRAQLPLLSARRDDVYELKLKK